MARKLTTRPDTSAFGRRITERMEALGLSDQDVAKATELGYDTIRGLRRLKNPNPTAKNLASLAKALKVDPNWLLPTEEGKGSDFEANADMGETADPALVKMTIKEAKEALARNYDVSPEHIEITIKG